MYDLNELIVNPSDAATLPFSAYGINNFGQIVGNHHVLGSRCTRRCSPACP